MQSSDRQSDAQSVDMFTVEQVSRLTGLSCGQLTAWDRAGFFLPAWTAERGRPFGRVYSFRDVVGLRTLAVLRNEHHVPLADLRRVGEWLAAWHDAPWSSLRFSVGARRVSFDDPDTGMRTAGRPLEQGAFPFEMAAVADEIRNRLATMRQRHTAEIGRIERRRRVAGNAPVLAGTRIPTAAVWSFHDAGYTVEQIIDEYPRLSAADIAVAIAFENERRAS